MARSRNIKPGIFKNELLGVADPMLTILFQSLWCLADKAGRLEDRPLRIKAETFPYREGLDVNGYLTELERMGFIHRYSVGDLALIQVVNFDKHQNPHKTEKESELPDYSMKTGGCAITVKEPLKHGTSRADSLIPDALNTDSGFPSTDSGKMIPSHVEQTQLDVVAEIFQYWQKIMESPKSVLDANRKKLIANALKNYSPADICKAIRGCSKSPHNMGQNDQKTKYNGLDLILRNAEKIDRFIALDAGNAKSGKESIDEANERVLSEYLGGSALDDGMTIDMEAR